MSGEVSTSIPADGVGRVRKNALNVAMEREIVEAMRSFDADQAAARRAKAEEG